MNKGNRYFKGSNFNRVMSIFSFAVFSFFTISMRLSEGWSLWVGLLFCGSVFSVIAIVEAFSTYLEIKDEKIVFRKNFINTVVYKKDIEKSSWAKGCPVYLILYNGSRIALPELNSKNISNSINAWLRKSGT